jgi:Na+-translocating ferredoxin:NAD+ oxidoreductase RNF subunit RnfB
MGDQVLASAAILAGIGLVFATFIALAHWRLRVDEDPRIDIVAGMLPGANCGACGMPGCRGFAEQLVAGKVKPAGCNVMDDAGAAAVAAFLGVDAGEASRRVARLLCAGGADVADRQAEYRGLPTCAAASAVAGGGKACAWGCLGLGDCAVACTFDAIVMRDDGLPLVDVAKCTACGDCVEACPKGLFQILPLDQRLLVQCRSLVEGDEALEACRVACTTCGKCVADAAPGLVSIASGVAVVDPARGALADPAATRRCPTGAIVWLAGAQFTGSNARGAEPALPGSRLG